MKLPTRQRRFRRRNAGRLGRLQVRPGRSTKPFNALAALGSAAHNGFERRAGIGVFLEPWLGRRATNLLWSVTLPFWLFRALAGRGRDEPMLAFNAGVAIAGSVVHFAGWPWSRRLGIFPWLDEAEGLPPEQLNAYNTILWGWLLGGLGSVVVETKREHLKFAAAGVATAPLLRASARHHFEWAREQAVRDPQSWSPWLLKESPSASVRTREAAV
jgi:hypothetical protein